MLSITTKFYVFDEHGRRQTYIGFCSVNDMDINRGGGLRIDDALYFAGTNLDPILSVAKIDQATDMGNIDITAVVGVPEAETPCRVAPTVKIAALDRVLNNLRLCGFHIVRK